MFGAQANMQIIISFSWNEKGSKVNAPAPISVAFDWTSMTWAGWVASWCPFLIFPLRVCCQVSLNGVHLLSLQTVSVASRLCSSVHMCGSAA